MTPTERSLAHLRKAGYECAIVEKYNAFIKKRQDLFNFADILAFRIGVPVLLVQTTSASNLAARRKKILANPIARQWVDAGNEIVLHSVGKRGARGERKTWTVEAEWVTGDMF